MTLGDGPYERLTKDLRSPESCDSKSAMKGGLTRSRRPPSWADRAGVPMDRRTDASSIPSERDPRRARPSPVARQDVVGGPLHRGHPLYRPSRAASIETVGRQTTRPRQGRRGTSTRASRPCGRRAARPPTGTARSARTAVRRSGVRSRPRAVAGIPPSLPRRAPGCGPRRSSSAHRTGQRSENDASPSTGPSRWRSTASDRPVDYRGSGGIPWHGGTGGRGMRWSGRWARSSRRSSPVRTGFDQGYVLVRAAGRTTRSSTCSSRRSRRSERSGSRSGRPWCCSSWGSGSMRAGAAPTRPRRWSRLDRSSRVSGRGRGWSARRVRGRRARSCTIEPAFADGERYPAVVATRVTAVATP
jgi:hypothetical protein